MKIPPEKLKSVCKVGQGPATCRYLAVGGDGIVCKKGTPIGLQIDRLVELGSTIARGDNCPGLGK